MKTLNKTIILLAFLIGFKGLSAQGDVIAPLFGFEETTNLTGSYTFLTVNQVTGETFTIEILDTFELDQTPFTIDYDSNIMYFVNQQFTGPTLNSISVPEIYNSSFDVFTTTVPLQGVVAMEYLRSQNVIVTLSDNILQTVEPSTGQGINQVTVAFGNGYDFTSTSMSSNGTGIYITGFDTIANNVILAVSSPFTTIAPGTTALPQYQELILVSHPNLPEVYGISLDTNGLHHILSLDPMGNINEIGEIETCNSCILGTGVYYKDAMAIDWENEEMIAVRTETDNGNVSHYLSTFSLIDGTLIRETAIDNRIRNLFYDKAIADIVFPGDANHDKVVNMEDVLAIGVKYNSQVIPRPNPTTAWVGQIADANSDSLVTDVDIKHVDCNGDGQVNAVDIDAILENFSSIHNSEKSTNDDCGYQLYFSTADSTFEDAETDFEVNLGSPANIAGSVYGISFTIQYDNNFVTENSMSTEAFNSWFGSPGLDHINVYYDEHIDGLLHVAITGIDLQNRSGGGSILRGRWTMEGEVIPIAQGSQDIAMRIDNVVIMDKNENILDGCGSSDTITVFDKLLGIKNDLASSIDIYPIPAKNSINIEIYESIFVERFELYGVDGKFLKEFSPNTHLNLETFDPGIYILQVFTKSGIAKKKVILE